MLGLLLAFVATDATAADKDCADFANQKKAQEFFDKQGPGDPHRLDADGDGIACEDNPCPCAGSGGGGGNGGKGDKSQRARVVSVTDGDTVKVKLKGRTRDVRLIGIDTPEVFSPTPSSGATPQGPSCWTVGSSPRLLVG